MKFTKTVTSQETKVLNSVRSSFTMTIKRSESAANALAVTSNAAAATSQSDKAAQVRRSTSLNVNREHIQDFALARANIFPVMKSPRWVETTKGLLAKLDPTNTAPGVLFFSIKNIPGTSLGYTLAIVDEAGSLHYILPSYLEVWCTTEKVLQELALTNLERKLISAGPELWTRSKAGVFYMDGLGSLSASVLLHPQFIESLEVESGDPVILVPVNNLCMVTGSKMETQLCIMGDIALRYSNDPQCFDLKPLRLSKHTITEYSPRSDADEYSVPNTFDEVAGLKLRIKPLRKCK